MRVLESSWAMASRTLLFSLASTWPKEKWIWMHVGGINSALFGKGSFKIEMRQAELRTFNLKDTILKRWLHI